MCVLSSLLLLLSQSFDSCINPPLLRCIVKLDSTGFVPATHFFVGLTCQLESVFGWAFPVFQGLDALMTTRAGGGDVPGGQLDMTQGSRAGKGVHPSFSLSSSSSFPACAEKQEIVV